MSSGAAGTTASGAATAATAARLALWAIELRASADCSGTTARPEYVRAVGLLCAMNALGPIPHQNQAPCSNCLPQHEKGNGRTATGSLCFNLGLPTFEAGRIEAVSAPRSAGEGQALKEMLASTQCVCQTEHHLDPSHTCNVGKGVRIRSGILRRRNRGWGFLAGTGGTGPPMNLINLVEHTSELLH